MQANVTEVTTSNFKKVGTETVNDEDSKPYADVGVHLTASLPEPIWQEIVGGAL